MYFTQLLQPTANYFAQLYHTSNDLKAFEHFNPSKIYLKWEKIWCELLALHLSHLVIGVYVLYFSEQLVSNWDIIALPLAMSSLRTADGYSNLSRAVNPIDIHSPKFCEISTPSSTFLKN